jgi:hypothetical protein
VKKMMDERQVDQGALFYEFSLERQVPADHMLRAIDRFVDLGEVRPYLIPFYSTTGRPSVDPELLIRMLIIGYCYGIRSERRLCEEVHRARHLAHGFLRAAARGARDMARHIGQSDAGRASRRQRKKVEILFAHLKRILRLDRLRLRGPNGARDEFLLAATVQNLRKLAKLVPEPTPAGAS